MVKLLTITNIFLCVGVFIASLLPNLYMSGEGNNFDDIKTIFIIFSGLFGALYANLRENNKELPKAIWIFLLFAAFSSIDSYIIKATTYPDYLDIVLIGESLGVSVVFTLVFGFWFFIGNKVGVYL